MFRLSLAVHIARRLGEESGDTEEAFNETIDAAADEFGSDSYLVALLCNALGEALQARDDEEDDEETIPFDYRRALAIIEQRYGPFDARLIPVLRNLASFYDQVGRFGEAETMVSRIELIEELTPPSRRGALAAKCRIFCFFRSIHTYSYRERDQ